MKPIDLSNVNENGGGNKLPAGGYVIKIVNAVDASDKNYLRIEYDIAEGEYTGYYKQLVDRIGCDYWPARYMRSYAEKAQGFYKHFLSCIDKSNGTNYVTVSASGINEATLAGKRTGIVLAEEEYDANNGERKTRLYVAQELPVDEIRKGNYKVPEIKRIKDTPVVTGNEGFMQVDDTAAEGLPFA